jgi:hypothetical protein
MTVDLAFIFLHNSTCRLRRHGSPGMPSMAAGRHSTTLLRESPGATRESSV